MKTTTEFQLVSTDKLIPYVNNARTHSPEQIMKLRSSLREFGFVNPVIIDRDFNVLAGHGRIQAAKAENIPEVPCVFADHLTEAQKKAYILADNRMALDAGWDEELLAVEMQELQDLGFDLSMTGFSEDELAELFATDAEGEEDDFDVEAELQKPCFSKTGDVWHLGRHTVICGDSTLPETYQNLLGDVKVNLVCTDAPYFVDLQNASGKIRNDNLDDKSAYEFLMKVFVNFKNSMAKDASFYEFYATSKSRIFCDAFEDAGFKVGAGLIWKKPQFPLSRTDWKYNMEPIIYSWRKEFDGIRNSKEDGFGHPSSKPVPLIAYLVKLSTQTNGIVLDGFLGSASTLIACEQTERICYGVEIEPKFVDVAVKRYIQQKNGCTDDVFVIRDGVKLNYADVEIPEEQTDGGE